MLDNGRLRMPKKILPNVHGQWEDPERKGNCLWIPEKKYKPGSVNPYENTWGEILEAFGLLGINFVDLLPDFDPIRNGNQWKGELPKSLVNFKITSSRAANFAAADRQAAKGTSLTKKDMEEFRYIYNLTWHEEYNTEEMRLVYAIVHDNVAHTGGIAVVMYSGLDSNTAEEGQMVVHQTLGTIWQSTPCLWTCAQQATSSWQGIVSFSSEAGEKPNENQLASYGRMLKQKAGLAEAIAAGKKAYSIQLAAETALSEADILKAMSAVEIHFPLMQPNGRNCLSVLGANAWEEDGGWGVLLEETDTGYRLLRVGPQSAVL